VVIAQGNGYPLEELNAGSVPFTTSATGTVEAIVDWTFASNDLDVYLARGACSFEQLIVDQCTILSFSESTTAKPERPRATNVPAGTHTMWVVNIGPGDESVSYQVVFTANATAGTPPAAAASQSESRGPTFGKGRPAGSVPLR
jgi:hypothetical protein